MAVNVNGSSGATSPQSDIRLGKIEVRPYRPFKSKDEYLYAMKEDLAEWLKGLYELDITADNFCELLETGTALCRHANHVRRMAVEYLAGDARARLPFPVPAKEVTFREHVQPTTFPARDNVSNFISWCRALNIMQCLLFETDDLVLRKNEKSFILCLLEVARRGSKVGMPTPLLVQMEEEIDREIARDNAKRMRDSGVETDPWPWPPEPDMEPPRQIITNDLKSLDEMVRDLVNRCTCPVQFPMIRISEGKYRIGDTKTLIFVRILRNHVMVRVGGGWDTLAHYLDKHDPCRCRQGHRATIGSTVTVTRPTTKNMTNINNQTQMMVEYQRSPEMTVANGANGPLTNNNSQSNAPLPPPRNRSISPIHYQQLHPQGSPSPPARQRRASTSSSASSHEQSTESSVTGEPCMVNLTVGSDDSNYSSIRATPPSQRRVNELTLETDFGGIVITPPPTPSVVHVNGTTHDVTDFANGVQHASTPIDDCPNALNSKCSGSNNNRKSRIPTCAEVAAAATLRKKGVITNVKNGHVNVENGNVNRTKNGANVTITTTTNRRRASSTCEPRLMPRSQSHTDDMLDLGSGSGFTRSQDVRRSCRMPRSPSNPQWTPASHNGLHSDKNRTWSGFRPGQRLRPSISPDIFVTSRSRDSTNNNINNNSNHHNISNGHSLINGSSNHANRPSSQQQQVKSLQSSPVKHCPSLLRELLCDTNLDTNEKVLEKIEKIMIANPRKETKEDSLKMAATDAILPTIEDGGDDDDYTKRWLTDVDKFSKESSVSTSQGIASPDYGSDFGSDAHTLPKSKKPTISMVSPRKNNHPATETKIPMPTY